MHKIFLQVAIFLLFWTTGCQGKSETQGKDTEAKAKTASTPQEVLEQAMKNWRALKSYSCDMVLTIEYGGGSGDTMVGKYFYREGQYHIDLGEDEITCNGDSIMTWTKEFGHVAVGPVNPLMDLTVAGIYRLYKTANNIKAEGLDGGYEKYSLVFSSSDDSFPHKTIWLDPKTGLIAKYALNSNDMGNYIYELKNVKTDQPLDDKLFFIDWDFVRKAERGEIPPQEHEGHHH